MFIMKKLKFFTGLLMTFVMISSTMAQSPERVLAKSFNLKGKDIVAMQVDGNVEVKEWGNDIMRIQMNIELTNGTNSMLKSLIQAKRYHLIATVKGEELVVNMPSLEKRVKISGRELTEKISYTVFAPAHVQVKLANESSASKNNDTKDSSAL